MYVKSRFIRVLLTNIGLKSSHQNSNELVCNLSTAGIDVIYLGNCRTSAEAAQAATQEDVDLLVVNFLSFPNRANFNFIIDLLKEANALSLSLFVCGVMNEKDAEYLQRQGVSEVLIKDTPTDEIISRLQAIVSRPRSKQGN